MSQLQPNYYGTAVFGTSDGLVVQGNGILSQKYLNTSVLDFSIGRGYERPLHRGSTHNIAFFRRLVRSHSGDFYELLGLVAPCADQHNRHGFYGACVAIEPDSVRPDLAIYDWEQPFTLASKLFQQISEQIAPGVRILVMPQKPLIAPNEDRDEGLKLTSNGELLLNRGELDVDDPGFLQRLKATAFVTGDSCATIALFLEDVKGTTPIDGAQCEGHLQRMRESVSTREAEIQRERDRAQAAKKRMSRFEERDPAAIGVTEIDRRAAASTERDHPSVPDAQPSLEERVKSLEKQYRILQSQVDKIHFKIQPGLMQRASQGKAGEEDRNASTADPRERRVDLMAILWIGGVLLALVLIAFMIFRMAFASEALALTSGMEASALFTETYIQDDALLGSRDAGQRPGPTPQENSASAIWEIGGQPI